MILTRVARTFLDCSPRQCQRKTCGGRLSVSFTLWTYISFADKLTASMQQKRALLTRLPKWFDTDFFEIEARAEGNPTRDQMRLMMQSLLSERFKLTVHFESPVVPVLALTIVKPGKPGPKLRPHAEGSALRRILNRARPHGRTNNARRRLASFLRI